jgi:vacuolar-type H+-ATPase subunit I/STV1
MPQAPFPSVADIGFLALPVAAAVALWQYPARRSSQTRLRQVLDALIVTGSMFVLSWAGVLSAVYAAARSEDRLPLTVSLAYPVADLLLITMIVMLLSRAGTTDRWPLGLLCAGIVLLSVSDSVFAVLTATHPYQQMKEPLWKPPASTSPACPDSGDGTSP